MRSLYSALFILLLPFVVLRMLWRSRRAPAYRERLAERLGYFTPPADNRPLLWVHAVSLGETLAARPLIERLLDEMPHYQLAVTTTTPTGSAQVRRLFGDRVFHVYAPWDSPGCVRRSLARLKPAVLVLMETELWPNMLAQCARRGCRVLLANARLSQKSADGYARFPGLSAAMMRQLDRIAAQAEADRERFVALGAPAERVSVCGSIKFDLELSAELRGAAAALADEWQLGDREVMLAASTHEPEEALVLDAWERRLAGRPGGLLLLAPRHPERFDEVFALCTGRGLRVLRRSAGAVPDRETQVLLLDTLGEVLLFSGLAQVAVIGGSFIDRGGHNPLEAAAWGVPVLTGPSMFNFATITRELEAASALERCADAAALAQSLDALLDDPGERSRRGNAAQAVVERNRGAGEALFSLVQELAAAP